MTPHNSCRKPRKNRGKTDVLSETGNLFLSADTLPARRAGSGRNAGRNGPAPARGTPAAGRRQRWPASRGRSDDVGRRSWLFFQGNLKHAAVERQFGDQELEAVDL